MDTCIRIPGKVSLMLKPCSEVSIMEMEVSLWAKKPLKVGLYLNVEEENTINETLEVFSNLDSNDVS